MMQNVEINSIFMSLKQYVSCDKSQQYFRFSLLWCGKISWFVRSQTSGSHLTQMCMHMFSLCCVTLTLRRDNIPQKYILDVDNIPYHIPLSKDHISKQYRRGKWNRSLRGSSLGTVLAKNINKILRNHTFIMGIYMYYLA